MSGYGYDTSTLVITLTLPDGREVTVVGANDGVNGYAWSARLGDHQCAVDVDETVLIDGITEQEDE